MAWFLSRIHQGLLQHLCKIWCT